MKMTTSTLRESSIAWQPNRNVMHSCTICAARIFRQQLAWNFLFQFHARRNILHLICNYCMMLMTHASLSRCMMSKLFMMHILYQYLCGSTSDSHLNRENMQMIRAKQKLVYFAKSLKQGASINLRHTVVHKVEKVSLHADYNAF